MGWVRVARDGFQSRRWLSCRDPLRREFHSPILDITKSKGSRFQSGAIRRHRIAPGGRRGALGWRGPSSICVWGNSANALESKGPLPICIQSICIQSCDQGPHVTTWTMTVPAHGRLCKYLNRRRPLVPCVSPPSVWQDFLGLTPPPDPGLFPPNKGRDFFHFEVLHKSKLSDARVGVIHTPHGRVDTPGFVAVATNAALKAVDHHQADEAGQQLMFCNTYHLLLQPGPDTVRRAGGLHRFMNRNRPIITDSGGFQVFSLSQGSVSDELNMKARGPHRSDQGSLLDDISEKGATFRSYRDGTQQLLTPESSVEAQKAFGADIIVPLDELPPYHIEIKRLRESVHLTHRWEARSLATHLADLRQQAMYGVIHGGVDYDLRQLSIDYISALPFDGNGIGGSLGKDRDELCDLLRFVMPRLKASRPNHLLGIADVESISRAVPLGVDTFDSCFPTRMGRHGEILTRKGRIKVRRAKYRTCFTPPDPEWGLQNVTLAYLHYLIREQLPLAGTLLTLHNIKFMSDYMAELRAKICKDEI